nr:gustatory receptor 32 [Papilio polytes]
MKYVLNYSPNEIFLDNSIERDIQLFLRPLNLLHYVTLSTKYSIRYNFITSNSRFVNFISLCSSVVFITTYFIVIFLDEGIFKLDVVLLTLLMVNFCVYAFSYLLNSYMNVVHCETNVDFIIKIKNIKKCITSDGFCKKITIFNWLYVVITIVFHFIIVFIHVRITNFELFYGFVVVTLLINDLNIIYVVRMIKFLRILIDLWASELKTKQLNIIDDINEETRQKKYWDLKRKTFVDVIDASSMYKDLCQIQISCHIVIIFMQLLNNVQYVITSNTFTVVIFILLMWTIKNIALLISISFECEMLFISLKNTQVLFLKAVADKKCTRKPPLCSRRPFPLFSYIKKKTFFTAFERLAYKSLRRGNSYSPLVACGMLTVDASLPLRFLSVLTTYTAVLLQIPFS